MQLDSELAEIVGSYDFKKIEADNTTIIEATGDCYYSCMSIIELMQGADCMCIGLEIQRPEAAIADPSRLIIRDILPTYISADSFLESARFMIEAAGGVEQEKAHGGFNEKKGHLALGLGRESITGVMPLYFFQEHWQLAKKKAQQLFGLMCTLDIMGYSSE